MASISIQVYAKDAQGQAPSYDFSITVRGSVIIKDGAYLTQYTYPNPTDDDRMRFATVINDSLTPTPDLTFTVNPPSGYKYDSVRWEFSMGAYYDSVTGVTAGIRGDDLDAYGSGGLRVVCTILAYSPTTYTITYNPNGGSGSTFSETKQANVAYTISSYAPTRSGFIFRGWSTSSTATTAQYVAGDRYTGNANLTLYAVWERETYTVSYNANGGESAPASQSKQYGIALQLTTEIPTRRGYTFLFWNTKPDGTGTNYYPGGTYTDNAPITLYAQWKPIGNTYVYMAHVWQLGQWRV